MSALRRWALAAALALGACGSPPPRKAPSWEVDPVRARAEEAVGALFAACADRDPTRVMARVAYQGDETARRYRSAWRPDDADALAVAQGLCAVLPRDGLVEVLEVSTRPPTRQTASDWTMTTVQRGATRLFLAFVEADGALLLGELQPLSDD